MCIRCMRLEVSAQSALNQVHARCTRVSATSVVATAALNARGRDVLVQAASWGLALAYSVRCAAYAQRAMGALGEPCPAALRPD